MSEAPVRPLSLAATFAMGLLAGPILGAITNSISGRVCPEYFQAVMRWEHIPNIARAAVSQGIFEGVISGFFLSLLLTLTIGIVAQGRCHWSTSAKYVLGVVASALVLWLIVGLAAVLLASIDPDWYRSRFFRVPETFDGTLRYAFVGGSIWGLQFGGFASVVIACLLFRAHWRARTSNKPASPYDTAETV